ncbi:MAG TPA: hypothetical protein VGN20_22045 [Mucilaginibacter sp.]|jgi:hypothetical protein
MGRLFFIIPAIILLPFGVIAQECAQWPAPCPHSTEINGAMDFAGREQGNNVTPQEMAMEANLRNTLTDMLHNFTRSRHWQLYELNESNYDRPNTSISFAKWCAAPYEKRPPHQYEISFIIIVNKDSLEAWRDWLKNEMPQKANQVAADMNAGAQNMANDQVLKAQMDSVQYYAQLSAKYMQDHFAAYQSDLQSNNEKGIKKYNDGLAEYQKKQDALMKRIQDRASGTNSASTNSYKQLDAEKVSKTETFINASVVLVNFVFNPEHATFGLTDGTQVAVIPQKSLTIPGAWYAGLLHNPSPSDGQSYYMSEFDYVYDHPSNIGVVLFGKWQSKRNAYNYTPAAYMANKAADDLESLKMVKCDKVQNMVLRVEGRPDYIKEVLNGIDMASIQKLVTQ